MLYKFERLKSLVDKIAPSFSEMKRKNLVVKGEDFTSLYRNGKTFFKDDGIYVEINGIAFKRFIYMRDYKVKHYNKFPVFHIIACSKVNDIGRSYYLSGSTPTVDVIDRDTQELYKDKKLKLCSYCRQEYLQDDIPDDTEDFFNSLEQIEEDNIEPTDIRPDGYTWDWDIVSEKYRKAKNHTCENQNCGIKITDNFDWHFIEVHHKNHNKSFNNPKNLIALCILCHCYQDDLHKNNMKKIKKIGRKLDFFIEKYKDNLKSNPFLKQYLSDKPLQ